MNKNLKRIMIILIFILAYIAGCIFPIKNIMPILKPNGPEVTKYEMYSLWINGILAFFTFLTVVVALLKEEIINWWKKPILYIDTTRDLLVENIVEDNKGIVAESYDIIFYLVNKGRNDAKNIKIIITDITFFDHKANNQCPIAIKDNRIALDNKETRFLSSFYPLMIKMASLKGVQNQSSVAGTSKIQGNVLTIGKNEMPEEYHHGEIRVVFRISCDGGYAITQAIKLKWDKKWLDRKADIFPKHLNIEFDGGKQNG